MKKALAFILSLGIFTGVGSVYHIAAVPYVVFTAVSIIILPVAFNKINPRYYPYYIFGLALALIWQTSMIGTHIIGVDIHSEYYVVQTTLQNGWDKSWGNIGNTSIILTVIAPALDKIGFSSAWQFKALYPFICAFTPVVLYQAFKNVFGDKKAFFGALFFIIMPMYSMEVASMVKSQIAYLCLAGIVWAFTSNLKSSYKASIIMLLAIGTMITHYTVGVVTLIYLVGIFTVIMATNWWKFKNLLGERTFHTRYFIPIIMCVGLFFYVWFTTIGGGGILNVSKAIVGAVSEKVGLIEDPYVNPDSVVISADGKAPPPQSIEAFENTKQSALAKTAIGLDISEVSTQGKLFRIVQIITQLLIVIGAIYFYFKRKEFNVKVEYMVGIIGSFILLACALFMPYFSQIVMTTTRLYAITLFFVAPMVVVGIAFIARKFAFYAIAALFIIYFAFTSGLIFETTHNTQIERIDTPFSIAFSNDRIGFVGDYNKDDIQVGKWATQETDKSIPIWVDYSGMSLVIETSGYDRGKYNRPDEPHYLLLHTWNTEHDKMVFGWVEASRVYSDLPDLSDYVEVYRQGDAVVYRTK